MEEEVEGERAEVEEGRYQSPVLFLISALLCLAASLKQLFLPDSSQTQP